MLIVLASLPGSSLHRCLDAVAQYRVTREIVHGSLGILAGPSFSRGVGSGRTDKRQNWVWHPDFPCKLSGVTIQCRSGILCRFWRIRHQAATARAGSGSSLGCEVPWDRNQLLLLNIGLGVRPALRYPSSGTRLNSPRLSRTVRNASWSLMLQLTLVRRAQSSSSYRLRFPVI